MGMRLPKDLERKVLAASGVSESDTPAGRRPVPPRPRRLAVEATLPVKLVSEANVGRRLRGKIARKGEVKAAVAAGLPRLADPFPLPAVVTLTRLSPAEMDGDNLQACFKSARDQVAAWLGLDDRDPRVKWVYRQRPAYEAGVTIRVEHTGPQT